MGGTRKHGSAGFRVIGAFKLVGAVLLLGAGFGVFRLVGGDVGATLEHVAETFRLDPHNRYLNSAIAQVSGLDDSRLRAIGIGTILYALLYGTEAVGLLLGTTWGGYLTVVATGSLVPVEIYEIARKPTAVRIAVFAINVAIVVYLIWQLIRERREAKRDAGP